MCLSIPGQILKIFDDDPHYAMVDVSGVRRKINIDLLKNEGVNPGDWVLIHVGFAMSKISEKQAIEQLELLSSLGESEEALQEVMGYQFDGGTSKDSESASSQEKEGLKK